jgi:putative transposase
MLSPDDMSLWSRGLSEDTRALITRIRSSPPSRRVGGGRSNVCGRYPSKKMGVTIQFESHRVELAFVHEMEHDPDVLEYYDQPPAIPLEYRSANGRRLTVRHTPDYFVIRRNTGSWEECKTEEDLGKLGEKNPNRYCRGADGGWCCPPGEAYAAQFRLRYRVRSSAEINWVYQRNTLFLEDYFRLDFAAPSAHVRDLVLAQVSADPGLCLSDLFQRTSADATRDDVHWLIAAGAVYVDLYADALVEPDKVHVFLSQERSAAHQRIEGTRQPTACGWVDVAVGSSLSWDGRTWTVVNTGDTRISLAGETDAFTEMPLDTFETLIKQGRITGNASSSSNSEISGLLAQASTQDLKIANERFDLVHRHLDDKLSAGELGVPERTLRFWTARYRQAKEKYCSGYVGLLPHTSRRGNRSTRLPDESRKLLIEFIKQDYETPKQKSKFASWAALKRTCEEQGIVAPSYVTFCLAVEHRPTFERIAKRQGHRAAYVHEPFCWELSRTAPRHGDRPFEIGHIDHTELDVEVVCSQTSRVLGRPWMTLLTDAFSRRVLSVYLTFDEPSYRSCMMILRECVRRHARLPQIVVVDNGSEFGSTYFETLLARYECTKKARPSAKARFGSVIERLFGVANTQFIHNLRGNTQITRNVRQVTKSVDPKEHAAWTLGELHEKLCRYLFEVYDTNDHPALGQSPREAFCSGSEMAGNRPQRMIRYDQEFWMCTLPSTLKGTAKVLPGCGVKINYLYYWSDTFRDPEIECEQVPVRYDPFDAGTAYAFVRHQWVRCHSEHYVVFQGRSEREVMVASKELRRRHQRHSGQLKITASKLADLLQSIEVDEVLLAQRLCDRESQTLRSGLAPTTTGSERENDDQVVKKNTRLQLVMEAPTTYETYEEF